MKKDLSLGQGHNRSEQIIGLCLAAPLVIWLVIMVVYPLFYTFNLSFQDQKLLGSQSQYIGLGNFIELFHNRDFWDSLKNSLIWTISNAVLQGICGLVVALLLNQPFRGNRFMRVWVILPWIIPVVVMAIIWKWMFNSTFGVIGWLAVKIGLAQQPPVFMGDLFNAMPTVIFVNVWRWTPFLSVVILAALQTIPTELYEAAKVDGSGAIRTFFSITMPSIQGTMSTMLLIGTLFSFNMFEVIWLMTEGGPLTVTTTLPVMIYKASFRTYRISHAASISVVVFLILVVFVMLVTRISSLRELEGED